MLAAISTGGTRGVELHRRFGAPAFGWPRDAINGAVLTLLAGGNIRASKDNANLAGPKELPPNQIGKVTLYKEDEPPSKSQRLAVRGLLTHAEIVYEPGQEGAQIAALLQQLKDFAGRAGGRPPLPEPPETSHVDDLLALSGNQRFRAVGPPPRASSGGTHKVAGRQSATREARGPMGPVRAPPSPCRRPPRRGRAWRRRLPPSETAANCSTILIPPHRYSTSSALPSARRSNSESDSSDGAQRAALEGLQSWGEWTKLTPADQDAIVADVRLSPADPPDVLTDAELLQTLDAVPLAAWQDRVSLVASRLDQARQLALERLRPGSVHIDIPPVTVTNQDDLAVYLDDVRSRVKPHLGRREDRDHLR